MIQYMIVKDGKLVFTDTADQADIVRLVAPAPDEIKMVSELTTAPTDLLSAACDKDERPRFETEDNMHLIVLRGGLLNQQNL